MAAPLPSHLPQQGVVVRQVWASNLQSEFSIIAAYLPFFRFVAIDTEFPGCIVRSATPYCQQPLEMRYSILKRNVDSLKLIQLGLVLFDADGKIPGSVDLYTGASRGFVWEFNFRDFDVHRDPHSPESIALLRSSGIDFDYLRLHGIDSADFAALCYSAGLVSDSRFCTRVPADWVAFVSCYDFGYLVKVLTRRALPNSHDEFMDTVGSLFGRVIDVKNLMKHCGGLYGGLETVAETLGLAREVGKAHQAGSDVLLTCNVFLNIMQRYFEDECKDMEGLKGIIPF